MATTLKAIESRLNKAISKMRASGVHLMPTGIAREYATIAGENCGCLLAVVATSWRQSSSATDFLGCDHAQLRALINGFEKHRDGLEPKITNDLNPAFYALGAKFRKRALNSAFAKRARAAGWRP